MMPGMLLTCALALPLSFAHNDPRGSEAVFRMLLSMTHKEYSDAYKSRSPVVLLVDDSPTLVDYLRGHMVPAWAMSRFTSMSEWQFQGDIERSPITDEGITIAMLSGRLRHIPELLGLHRMLRRRGFLIIDISMTPSVDRTLKKMGYEHLPFKFHQHDIYRKSMREDA